MTADNNSVPDWAAKRSVRDEQRTLSGHRGKSGDEWLAQSRDSINAYYDHVREHGVFSGGLRFF
ncbi:hypothetical protein [Stutzerimonas stutzeri]|uniref:Acetoacetyl-CoA synthase n=1 Tax=Stutzerimonas stutzeri TaxID=316 RepID=A0A0D9ALU8_STUST|nr:hypothetical protein [Stutzerimonas stutzeri]KJH80351.1 hypothetical protein UF78_14785 [Stutzerimonas stutzeri]